MLSMYDIDCRTNAATANSHNVQQLTHIMRNSCCTLCELAYI